MNDSTIIKLPNCRGSQIMRDFVGKLTGHLSEGITAFCDDYPCDALPFLYSEVATYSLFAAAIDKITRVHVSEQRSDRKLGRRKKLKYGRTDFWCNYRGVEINIEVKHHLIFIHNHEQRKSTASLIRTWGSLVNQTAEVGAPMATWQANKVAAISIMILVPYTRRVDYQDDFSLNAFSASLLCRFDQANFCSSTPLKQVIYEWNDDGEQYIPGICFVGQAIFPRDV